MSTWYTKPERSKRPVVAGGKLAPSLLYHKWHAYDDDLRLEHKESRPEFLRAVAQAVESARSAYPAWLERYRNALREAVREDLVTFEAKTVWRLAVGMATNPALEIGLSLHPFLGFPFLSGSAVKGLTHHVAESELISKQEEWVEGELFPPLPDVATLLTLLADAELVKALFGSLHLLPAGPDSRPRTARSLLERWLKLDEFPHELQRRTLKLLQDTGGLLAFYDAVPAEDGKSILQIDVMTPHYPKYYDERKPPSDDQDPTPLLFLAVRPGVKFHFAFRIGALPRAEPRDDDEKERARLLDGKNRQELAERVKTWLERGLERDGAGAKTAAGYGYFQVIP